MYKQTVQSSQPYLLKFPTKSGSFLRKLEKHGMTQCDPDMLLAWWCDCVPESLSLKVSDSEELTPYLCTVKGCDASRWAWCALTCEPVVLGGGRCKILEAVRLLGFLSCSISW